MNIIRNSMLYANYPQVSKEHYHTIDYLSEARFLGLHAQFKECFLVGKDKSFLNIGIGPGFFDAILRADGFNLTTLDIAIDLNPDIAGDILTLPFRDKQFDVVCAFEVLEHLPFSALQHCLREIKRVSAEKAIISLPSQQEIYNCILDIQIKISDRISFRKIVKKPIDKLANSREHYWEIGFEAVTPQTVINVARDQGLILVREYFKQPWFHIFSFNVA